MNLLPRIGLGCDIEEIERFFLDPVQDIAFLRRVFTPAEIEYCYTFQSPAPHLAARFCAKEAVIKALGSLGEEPVPYHLIEISRLSSGAPVVTIHAETLIEQTRYSHYHFQTSLSHSRTTAMAVVLITEDTDLPAES